MFFIIFVVLLGILAYYKWALRYWTNKNIPRYEELVIPLRNVLGRFAKPDVYGLLFKKMYLKMKSKGHRHAGAVVLLKPVYIVRDPKIMRTILQVRFNCFSDRFHEIPESGDYLETNLVFAAGEKWKYLRSKISPAFTPAKIKGMFDIIVERADQMKTFLDFENKGVVDIEKVGLCYFTNILGSCAFGLDLNSFYDSKFINHAKQLIDLTSKIKLLKILLKMLLPSLSRRLGISFIDPESFQFFVNVIKAAAKYRKDNNVVRKDVLQQLLDSEPDLNVDEVDKKGSRSATIINEITSNAVILFVAGFDTTTHAFTFCLYELAANPLIQEKSRNEIDEVLEKYEGKITYEAITEMTYISQVIDESLRKYPSNPALTRYCVEDCEIDDTGVVIEKGTLIAFPIMGLHYDPEYYPDPEKFDPERFSEENKAKRPPFTYLPFGEGPRICPAYRFSLIQMKVGLSVLLQNYIISINAKTELPVEFGTSNFLLEPKTPILLNLESRKKIQ